MALPLRVGRLMAKYWKADRRTEADYGDYSDGGHFRGEAALRPRGLATRGRAPSRRFGDLLRDAPVWVFPACHRIASPIA